MPPLASTLRSSPLPGFVPVQALPQPAVPAPVGLPGESSSFTANRFIRSPLPPINSNPDTLRQFDDGDTGVPRRRLLPLPQITSAGGSTTTNTTVVSPASGGGSSSTTGLTTVTLNYVSPLLNVGSASIQSLNVASKSYQLISATANGACEIRIYGSAAAQASDFGRATYAPLAAELNNNMVTDVVFDTSPYVWNWQNRVGANQDSPQANIAYLTVFNTGSAPQNLHIAFVVLPLETAV